VRRLGGFAGRAARSLIAIWQSQSGFGRALMAMGIVSALACLLLAFELALYSALPWRGALSARKGQLPGATASSALAALPTRGSGPAGWRTPSPTPMPTHTPTPTRVPSRTPTPPPTPSPTAHVEVTASVSDSSPRRGSVVTVYGRITCDGRGVAGVPMRSDWEFRSVTVPCDSTTNGDGVASCSLPVLLAAKGHYVAVEVAFTYEGRTYRATTGFTPR